MIKSYFFDNNIDDKGMHTIHTEDCAFLPHENRSLIGYQNSCKDAIEEAKKSTNYSNFNGCYFCCYSCHTK
ncbi:hypothetical protein [Bacillus altitudinis]|uniref:hypothetical protein n=1 Tax=Bacillus altitudinis TaxID=293387 RepID=UPI0020209C7B|nr:hypothetical protein [Bacillus altitudinis]MCL7873514.1 hypothetical protein [Bacillus altitudinis]